METLILINETLIAAALLIATASFAFQAALQVHYQYPGRNKARNDLRHR